MNILAEYATNLIVLSSLGQDQDKRCGNFERDESYSGEISQLNFWGEMLDEKTINDVRLQ